MTAPEFQDVVVRVRDGERAVTRRLSEIRPDDLVAYVDYNESNEIIAVRFPGVVGTILVEGLPVKRNKDKHAKGTA